MLHPSLLSDAACATRVIVLVLDGLRADLIGDPRFPNLARLHTHSASTTDATTVLPSVTAVAMTSLLSGLAPVDHGVDSDRFRVPTPRVRMTTLPQAVIAAGLPASSVVRRVPWVLRHTANRIVTALGFERVLFAAPNAHVLLAANPEAEAWARRGRQAVVQSLLETAVEATDPPPSSSAGRAGVLWVGSDEARKNPEFALLAHTLLGRCLPGIGLTLVGLGAARERALRAWASEREIDLTGVRILARIPRADLVALYRGARLFWFTSYRDTSGNVLLEAMAHGAVPVAFAQHGAAAILDQGAGELVTLAAPRAMLNDWVRRSRRLMCDERAWLAAAETAITRCERRYRWTGKWPALRLALLRAGVWPLPPAASWPSSARMAPANRPPSPPCASVSSRAAPRSAPTTGGCPGSPPAARATW